MIAHGVSRGSHVYRDHQPQRGDRNGRLQCTENSREAAKPRRGQDVVSRRDAGIAQGVSWFALCFANANGVETPSPGLAEERGQPWV